MQKMTEFSSNSKDGHESQNYIVDFPESPNSQLNRSNNKLILPSIQDVVFTGSSRINDVLELNKTQQKIKNLEIRLQATEVSNRSLIEEVVRLQNEMVNSLRNNLDTLNEEKSARQFLETNLKFQYDTFMKTNVRLKQTEEQLDENRITMQSMIKYTRNLENSILESQKDLFARRDFQAIRLEELKKQIDDLQFSKENLERYTNSLLDELQNLKNKVEIGSLNFNSIRGDFKSKTQRLEDQNRLQLDIIQKHKNTLTTTENEVHLIKSSQENRVQEIRNLNIDLKQKLDFEIEQRKLNESSIVSKMSDLFSKVDEEKSKSVNLKRDFEFFKKEANARLDDEYKQISSTFSNTKEIILSNTSEKIEKVKDDIQQNLIEMQKSAMAESQKLEKFKQNFQIDMDSKIEKLKVFFLEELNHNVNELKNNFTKLNDIVNKLNEGITLIELQNDERNRRYEKVLNAEINSRKSKNVEFNEKLHNYNEKFSVTVQSLQASFEKLTTKVDTTRNQFVDRNEFFSFEKRIDDVKAEILQNNLKSSSLKEKLGQLETNSNNQTFKIKDLNDQLSQIENSKLVLINNRIEKLPSKEDFENLKIENEQKLEKEIQRIIKQNDIQYSDIKKSTDDRYDQLTSLLNSSNNRFQQKINMNEKLIKDQISLQNEYQQKYFNMFKEETKALILSNEENKKDEYAYIEEKMKNTIDVNEKLYESRIKTIEKEIKDEILSIRSQMNEFKGTQKNENTISDIGNKIDK